MVSIPDFSRWGRLTQVEKSMTIQEKYDKHREEEVIKCAKESGYFLNLTQQFILETFSESDDSKANDIRSIRRINVEKEHIRSIGCIEFCRNLRYLNLSGNYLTNIDALMPCQMLIKLDLSCNQLQILPRVEFWTSMRQLQVLHLHDNPIGQVDAISGMSGCRTLVVLTLYDSPISLKRNYRHHVVNSIWTLKALDHYVISDEEIIEDANFKNEKYKILSLHLRLRLYRNVPKNALLLAERLTVVNLLKDVNRTLAHNSPVLIIQRYIRGYLIRKKLKPSDNNKSISKLKALPPIDMESNLPAPTDHIVPQAAEDLDKKPEGPPPLKREMSSTTIIKGPSTREELLPYAATPLSTKQLLESEEFAGRNLDRGAAVESPAVRRLLHIDMKQLNASQMEAMEARSLEMDEAMSERQANLIPPDNTQRSEGKMVYGPLSSPASATQFDKRPLAAMKMRNHSGSDYPLLPYSESYSQTRVRDLYKTFELEESSWHEDQIPETPFRLVGRKEGVRQMDPVMEMILKRAEAGHMIREAESEYHRAKLLQPPPQIKKFPHQTNDQRLFGRAQCTMGTLLLQKWDRMDRDILLQDMASRYTENTVATRNAKAQSKRNIGLWKEDQTGKMKNQRRHEKRDIQRHIFNQRDKEAEEHKVRKLKRDKAMEFKENSQKERIFAQNFRGQHNSVSKALMKHDRYALGDEKLQSKSSFVKSIRENEAEKLETIRKYLDLQAKERHKEMAEKRQEIDSKILQEANQRILEAHTRVEHLRTLKRYFQEFPTVSNTYPEIDDSHNNKFKGMNRFEIEAVYRTGRVGKHPTVG